MGRQTWANDDQTVWLEGRKKAFADAQSANNTGEFFAATCEAFIAKWPIDEPSTADIAAHGEMSTLRGTLLLRNGQR